MLPNWADPKGAATAPGAISDPRKSLAALWCVSLLLTACATGPVGTDGMASMDLREHMTNNDRHIAAVAMQIAMERRQDNEASTWSNGLSGNHGAVVPRHTYRSRAGESCRRFDEMVTVAGVSATFERTACRIGDGHWMAMT